MAPKRSVTEPLVVRIADRNHDGRGRGQHGDRVVLVSQAAPGEELKVRIDRVTRGTVQGRVRELIRRDPERIAHECLHEFFCTGCPLLAASPAQEAAFKEERLRQLLAPIEGLDAGLIEPLRTPTEPFGHRALAKLVFARRRGRFLLGSYVAGTHLVADMRGCPVLVPELSRLLDELRTDLGSRRLPIHGEEEGRLGFRYLVARWSLAEARAQLVFASSEPGLETTAVLAEEVARRHAAVAQAVIVENRSAGNALLEGELRPLFGEDPSEELLGYRHPLSPRGFFQVNPRAAAVLFGVALEMVGTGPEVFEGYAGSGALTLPLSERFEKVVAVESRPESATALKATAARYGRGGVEVAESETASQLEAHLGRNADAPVVLDPPRAGIGPAVVEILARTPPRRLVLLSCEPASLQRDLPGLLGAGLVVRRIVPVDQFPRTAHLETVTLLENPSVTRA